MLRLSWKLNINCAKIKVNETPQLQFLCALNIVAVSKEDRVTKDQLRKALKPHLKHKQQK